MPIQVKLDITPALDRYSQQIGQLAETLTDDFDWASLAPVIADHAERIFRTQGGGKWAPLNPQYAAWKSRNYPGAPILVRTGQYLAAATNPGTPHNLVETGKDYIRFGVAGLDYALFHEEGRGRLPERPVFALLEGDQELQDDAKNALANSLRRN